MFLLFYWFLYLLTYSFIPIYFIFICILLIYVTYLFFGDSSILLTSPGIYPQICDRTLYPPVLIIRGSKKQQRRGRIISNFTKGETFFISYSNQVLIWKKNLLICFDSFQGNLYSHRQSRKIIMSTFYNG